MMKLNTSKLAPNYVKIGDIKPGEFFEDRNGDIFMKMSQKRNEKDKIMSYSMVIKSESMERFLPYLMENITLVRELDAEIALSYKARIVQENKITVTGTLDGIVQAAINRCLDAPQPSMGFKPDVRPPTECFHPDGCVCPLCTERFGVKK